MALMIGLALMSNGCASLSPSASNRPTWQQEMKQEQSKTDAAEENCTGWDFLSTLLYWGGYVGGSMLAN